MGEAPLPYRLGEQQQILRIRTEMLVRMQIDADAVPLGDGQGAGDSGLRVLGEVRAATEQVGPQLQCLVEDFVRCLDVQHGDLQRDPLAQLLAQPQQRPQPPERIGAGQDVGVGADGGRTIGDQFVQGAAGPDQHVLLRHLLGIAVPGGDRPGQVAGRCTGKVPGEGLVEVGVGFGGGGQQDEAGEVHLLTYGGELTGRCDGRHPPVLDQYVPDLPFGQPRPAQHQCRHRHRASPFSGAVSTAKPSNACHIAGAPNMSWRRTGRVRPRTT